MQPSPERPLTRLFGSCLILSFCVACSSAPALHVSADTYCEKSRPIVADAAQLRVYYDNWTVMKPYAIQVVQHNDTYNANCLEYTKGSAAP